MIYIFQKVQKSLLRLWLRVIAVASATHPDSTVPPAAKRRLSDWVKSVRGVSELDTSAPSSEWLVEVYSESSLLIVNSEHSETVA